MFDDDDHRYIHDDEIDYIFTNNIDFISVYQYPANKRGIIRLSSDCLNIDRAFINNDISNCFLCIVKEYIQREYEYFELILKYEKNKLNKVLKLEMLKQSKLTNDIIYNIITPFL